MARQLQRRERAPFRVVDTTSPITQPLPPPPSNEGVKAAGEVVAAQRAPTVPLHPRPPGHTSNKSNAQAVDFCSRTLFSTASGALLELAQDLAFQLRIPGPPILEHTLALSPHHRQDVCITAPVPVFHTREAAVYPRVHQCHHELDLAGRCLSRAVCAPHHVRSAQLGPPLALRDHHKLALLVPISGKFPANLEAFSIIFRRSDHARAPTATGEIEFTNAARNTPARTSALLLSYAGCEYVRRRVRRAHRTCSCPAH